MSLLGAFPGISTKFRILQSKVVQESRQRKRALWCALLHIRLPFLASISGKTIVQARAKGFHTLENLSLSYISGTQVTWDILAP